MADYVKSVEATGIYGRFDLQQTFQDGVNILYGKNGTGKTTFLHIISNVLNSDFNRFAYLIFKSIEVKFNDGDTVIIKRDLSEKDYYINVSINDESKYSFLESKIRGLSRDFITRTVSGGVIHVESPPEEKPLDPLLPTAYFPAFRTM